MATTAFKITLRRVVSLDTLIIIACDLALAIPCLITWGLLQSLATKLTAILGKVTLSTDLMMQNPSIASLNIALFRQASLYGALWLVAIAIVWALSLGILNSIQWRTVARKPFAQGLASFAIIESGWYLFCVIILFLTTFFVFEPSRIPTGLPVLILLFAHLSFGLHIGLLQNKKPLKFRELHQLLHPAFQHGLRWLIVYGLLLGCAFLSLMVLGLLLSLGIAGTIISAIFALLALAWWRMISWEIISGNVKRIP